MASFRPIQAAEEGVFHWPGSARAAVCMTYDDVIDQHLDNAAPDLENANLRGTFCVQVLPGSLPTRIED
jgi:sialate O-acetylesterase